MAAGKVAEKAIDVVADAAEEIAGESAEIAVATRGLSPRDVGILFGGIGVGAAVGFAGGYFLLRHKLELKYENFADKEIAGMKEHYNAKLRALEGQEEKKTLDELTKELQYAQEANDLEGKIPYHKVGSEPDKPVVETLNVFDQPEPEIEEEIDVYSLPRDPEVPYIIHKDEYDITPDGYEQYTLTYFEGDDVLSDDRDRVIEDQDKTVGLGNLSKFGIGSGDPNIVYIRNEELKVDIEVVHSDGKYATEVHGFQDDELKHSSMRRRPPRRFDDDPGY
jgi:hypothetical protein